MASILTKCGQILSSNFQRGCYQAPKCTVTEHYHVHRDLVPCTPQQERYLLNGPNTSKFLKTIDQCCLPAILIVPDILGQIDTSGNFTHAAEPSQISGTVCPSVCSSQLAEDFGGTYQVSFGSQVTVHLPQEIQNGYIAVRARDACGNTFLTTSKLCGNTDTLNLSLQDGFVAPAQEICLVTCVSSQVTNPSTQQSQLGVFTVGTGSYVLGSVIGFGKVFAPSPSASSVNVVVSSNAFDIDFGSTVVQIDGLLESKASLGNVLIRNNQGRVFAGSTSIPALPGTGFSNVSYSNIQPVDVSGGSLPPIVDLAYSSRPGFRASYLVGIDGTTWSCGETSPIIHPFLNIFTKRTDVPETIIQVGTTTEIVMLLSSSGKLYTPNPAYGNGTGLPPLVTSSFGIANFGGASLPKFIQVSCADNYCLALSVDGEVYSWGDPGFADKLGRSPIVNAFLPSQIFATSPPIFKKVIATTQAFPNSASSYALGIDGSVWAWGSNQFGQLGDGTNTSNPNPSQIAGLPFITHLAASRGGQAVALDVDGFVWAWGRNNNGQCGQDSSIFLSVNPPMRVPVFLNIFSQ